MKWSKQLAAGILSATLAASAWAGGPVLLGGDDLTDHGFRSGNTNIDGWLYIENAIKSLTSQSTRPGTITADIMALGSADPGTNYSSGAGSAIASAAINAGLTVTYCDGAAGINACFAALAAGTVNPKMMWMAGNGATGDIEFDEGQALSANAAAINNFVISGGGVMGHGSGSEEGGAYGWLATLIPGIVETYDCIDPLTFTPYGRTIFPGVSDANISSGPCHSSFSGNLGGLQVIAKDTQGLNIIIGGLTGSGGIAAPSTDHAITCPSAVTSGVSVNAPIITNLPGTVSVWLQNGVLPSGLGLFNGTLMGSTTLLGNYPITLNAGNSLHTATASQHCVLSVVPPAPVVVPPVIPPTPPAAPVFTTACPLPDGTLNLHYSQNIVATGVGPITYSHSGLRLPPGVTLSSAGLLSGTPVYHEGVYPFTLLATNAGGTTTLSCQVTIGLIAPPPVIPNPVISACPLSGAFTGSSYSSSAIASGGAGTLTFSLLSGSLPAGLSLASNGVVSGTMTTAGTSSFTLQVTDTGSRTGTAVCSITGTTPPVVIPAPVFTTSCPLPAGVVGTAYSQTLLATGGTAPLSFTSAGVIPHGLTLSSAGVLSGTPLTPSVFNFTLIVTDSGNRSSSLSCSATVGHHAAPVVPVTPPVVAPPVATPLSLTTTCPLPSATVLTAYATNLVAAGGTAPYSFSIIAGELPRPLTLSSNGLVSGSPYHVGGYNFTLQVRDAALNTVTRGCSMSVVSAGSVVASIGRLRDSGAENEDNSGAVRYELAEALPYDVYGRVTLVLSRQDKEDDGDVRFNAGGRTADFVIAAGETKAKFIAPDLAVMKGDGRGQIRLIFTLTDKDGLPVLAEQVQ